MYVYVCVLGGWWFGCSGILIFYIDLIMTSVLQLILSVTAVKRISVDNPHFRDEFNTNSKYTSNPNETITMVFTDIHTNY